MPIATERFAGGRGMALETHTAVRAKPVRAYQCQQGMRYTAMSRTCVAGSHEEHADIAATDRHGRQADDIAQHDAPPPNRKM